eukprot:15423032-Heterocapsa_arctica.AAC.1
MHKGDEGRCSLRIEVCRTRLGQHEHSFGINRSAVEPNTESCESTQENTAACHCSFGAFQVSRIEDRPLISLMHPAVLIPAE